MGLQKENALLSVSLAQEKSKVSRAPATNAVAGTSKALAEANRKLAGLQKENALLSVSLAQEKSKVSRAPATNAVAGTSKALAEANRKLAGLQKENDLLRVSLAQEKSKVLHAPTTNAVAGTSKALAEANRKLAEQTKTAKALALEKKALSADAEAAKALRTENQLLKKQLADLKAAPPPATKRRRPAASWPRPGRRLPSLQSDKELLQLEKTALESASSSPSAPAVTAAAAPTPGQSRRREAGSSNSSGNGTICRSSSTRPTRSLTAARARRRQPAWRTLKNNWPRCAPGSKLRGAANALYRRGIGPVQAAGNQTSPRPTTSRKKSVKELPPGTVALVAEANRYYANKKLDRPRRNICRCCSRTTRMLPPLPTSPRSNSISTISTPRRRNITQAVALAPDDSYSLFVLGRLRFRQKKYDEAIDALSRAAKLDPQDAQTQNFLGLALSEKGLRGPAETALRKAIQLDPGYANAHNNLAVVYITQQPPLVELARWHYQKALAAGQPHNLELEKMLDAKKPAGSGQ